MKELRYGFTKGNQKCTAFDYCAKLFSYMPDCYSVEYDGVEVSSKRVAQFKMRMNKFNEG